MEIFRNNLWATLASGIDNTQVTLPLTTGHGLRFGTINADEKLRIVLLNSSDNVSEIMYATGVTGDTLDIVRGQDGTSGVAHLAGARIEARNGKSTMESLMQSTDLQSAAETYLGSVVGVDAITASATPALTAQAVVGSLWKLPAAGANTGAATLNIDGQGAVAIVRPDGAALKAKDIPSANYPCLLEKRASDFVLVNPANFIKQDVDALVSQTHTGFTTTGTEPAYVLTPTMPLTAYAAGQRYRIKAHATSTSAPTLNVSGLGAKSVKRYDVVGAKVAGSMLINQLMDVEYDGTDFVVLTQLPDPSGRLIRYTEILASDPAWATHAETKRLVVCVVASGGGGAPLVQYKEALGGQAGEVAWGETTTIAATYNAVIGAAVGAGVDGQASSFGVVASAVGGKKGLSIGGPSIVMDGLNHPGQTGVNGRGGGGDGAAYGQAGVILVWEYS